MFRYRKNSGGRRLLGRKNTPPTFGFTLVELLVVVAIIALLVSILLPTLNKAKEQAISVVCKTNLKNIALATQLYTHNYNSWIHAAYSPVDGMTWGVAMRREGLLPEPSELNTLTYCPSRVTPRNTGWASNYYSYGQRMSRSYWDPPVGPRIYQYGWFNLSGTQVRCLTADPDGDFFYPYTPGEFVLFADTLDIYSGMQIYGFSDSTSNLPQGSSIEMRHTDKANCAFADSHVEGLGRTELNSRGFSDMRIWPEPEAP